MSMFCPATYLEQYVAYLDEVTWLFHRTTFFLCMDANACTFFYSAICRGEVLSEPFLKHDSFCLNMPFKNSKDVPDIDVRCANVAVKAFVQSWRLLNIFNVI